MSRAARRLRRQRDRQVIRAGVAVSTAARGCICVPEIVHQTIDGRRSVTVVHADTCPAPLGGPSLLLWRGHGQSSEDFRRAVATMLEELGS